jgi:hypothetical protein
MLDAIQLMWLVLFGISAWRDALGQYWLLANCAKQMGYLYLFGNETVHFTNLFKCTNLRAAYRMKNRIQHHLEP